MSSLERSDAPNASSSISAAAPIVELNDGWHIPRLGFGVWQVANDEVTRPVVKAIEAGYRSIDTAQGYDNEEGVGVAIRASGIDRDELFVTSKLRTKSMGYEAALAGIQESLDKIGLDYLDLFLIHWPTPARDTYVETWKALIKAKEQGLVRTVGVSNFLPEHIERIIEATGVFPAVNQIETHPYFQQQDVRGFHVRHGIQLESYSPLGSGAVLNDKTIAALARAHEKSPAQVILRWHMQEDFVAIPKSVTPDRIRQNLEVFDFELSEEEMNAIRALDNPASGRTGSDPATFNDLY
jgi:2,5-diketo-D-gluconate reductase A